MAKAKFENTASTALRHQGGQSFGNGTLKLKAQ
jgi:hypothetical protein